MEEENKVFSIIVSATKEFKEKKEIIAYCKSVDSVKDIMKIFYPFEYYKIKK